MNYSSEIGHCYSGVKLLLKGYGSLTNPMPEIREFYVMP